MKDHNSLKCNQYLRELIAAWCCSFATFVARRETTQLSFGIREVLVFEQLFGLFDAASIFIPVTDGKRCLTLCDVGAVLCRSDFEVIVA